MKASIRIAALLCGIVLGAAYLAAQVAPVQQSAVSIDGTWVGRAGSKEYTFQLKRDGDTLTGSVTPDGGQAVPIAEGEIDGENFAFQTVESGKTWVWSGYLDGEKIEGERETEADDSFETFSAELRK